MREPPPGAVAFRFAVLIDKFGLTPSAIAGLTDYQIDRLFFHARDADGKLIPPAAPEKEPPAAPTRETRLAAIGQLEAMGLITPERAQELRDEVNGTSGGGSGT